MTRQDIFSTVKAMSLGALWRHVASVTVVLGSIYAFAGPYVKSYAQDALLDMLASEGISPEDFKKVQQDLQAQGIDIDAIRAGTTHLNDELDEVKLGMETNTQLSRQTYDLLKTIIPMMRSEARP